MNIENNIFNFVDKILPLVSTMLGAFITYYVTIFSKKNEMKISMKIEARDSYWIPCVLALEKLEEKIAELKGNENNYVSFYGKNSCETQMRQLLNYCKADKRIFFNKKTRKILDELQDSVDTYENTLDNNCHSLLQKFEIWYNELLCSSDLYIQNKCIDCNITFKKDLYKEIRLALLTRNKKIMWRGQVTNVVFIIDADSGNVLMADMTCYFGDLYNDVWCPIKVGNQKIEEFEETLTPENKLGLNVLDYEGERINEFEKNVNEKIKNINYEYEYKKILGKLKLLKREILKDIDSITMLK